MVHTLFSCPSQLRGSQSTRTPGVISIACAALMGAIFLASPLIGQVADNEERRARVAAERFADSVVRVMPRTVGGAAASERGFGIIVGRRGQDLYVVTPNHVVFDRDQSLSDRPYVRFRVRPGDDVEAQRMPLSSPQVYDDLAVLRVPNAADRSPNLLSTGSLQSADSAGTWVWTIGRETGWTLPGSHGSFAGMKSDPLRQAFNSLPTAPGSSGAAVVTVNGIVGMVVSNTSATDTFAVSVDQIKKRLREWDIPTNLLEVQRDCSNASPTASSTPMGAVTITFDAVPNPDKALFDCYGENGFSVGPAEGDWRVGKGFGHPQPYIYFDQQPADVSARVLRVQAFGRRFTFQSVDLYASVTQIPYSITGFLDRQPVFRLADVIPNTFGNFVTVKNPRADVVVDTLDIELGVFPRNAVGGPVGLDTLVMTRK